GAAAEVSDPFPGVASSYLLKANGKTIWAHSPDRRLPPASLTKIMTALVVLERGRLDGVVTVSEAAARETGAGIGLKPGDRVRAGDLLAATLLGSANDACHALAEHIAGSEERFTRLMNERGRALGMRDTHFANSTGHHHPKLYSTARDLALLAEAVLAHVPFADLVSTVRMGIRTVDGRRTFSLENKNEIIGRYRGAIGVKTGYTKEAGPCLVALAERSGTMVLLVMLNAPNRWWDAVAMLDSAFRQAGMAAGDRRP
ncbi:MAG: D-alanyl-D-alanine carboxypeptidase, partial [Deltaproteobacteria bacterium]|nr:D-alanyl-D-alanine carboxypeptidase [Deltaproteobacteria bacterium]